MRDGFKYVFMAFLLIISPVAFYPMFEGAATELRSDVTSSDALPNWKNAVSVDITWENGIYRIYCPEELALMAQWINEGCSADQIYELMNDLDLEGREWTAIGKYPDSLKKGYPFSRTRGMADPWDPSSRGTEGYPFRGTFEGNKFIIYNLSLNMQGRWQGLFGYVENATIKKITLESYDLRGGPIEAGIGGSAAVIGARLFDCYLGKTSRYWRDMVSSDITWDNGVYKIYCPEELALMAQWVNDGCSEDQTYELMNDLDLGDMFWFPIGIDKLHETVVPNGARADFPFRGTFEGNNHMIYNLRMKIETRLSGLFGLLERNATIKHLALESFDIQGQPRRQAAGVLVGLNRGNIIACRVGRGRVSGVYIGLLEADNPDPYMEHLETEINVNRKRRPKDAMYSDVELLWKMSVSSDIACENGVYKIYCPEELALMAQWINSGCSADQTYRLMNDLDLGGRTWTAIGTIRGQYKSSKFPFRGTFEGDRRIISNLYIPGGFNVQGLFGYIAEDAAIRNLTLENFEVHGREDTAALVGVNDGSVINCCLGEGRITGIGKNVGSLVGKGAEPQYE